MRFHFLALVFFLPAFARAEGDHGHLSELDGFRAVHAWTRATTGDEALVFVELENQGAADVMIDGADSEVAAAAALVGVELKDGAPVYTVLPPLPVPAGREMHLDPDGLAIRLTGLSRDLAEGDEFEMHLETSLGEIELHVAVEADDAHQHSHAGHSH